jgi:very-short-patch-repair endonuclease
VPQNLRGFWEPEPLVPVARRLRRRQTDAERALWQVLRQRPGGFKFRRQHPIGRYILDFFCGELRLAIEADGGQHLTESGRKAGQERSAYLAEQGIRILRFNDHQILVERDAVLRTVEQALGLF